jgi:PIN domain nuclease of toxin-antitoxin system
MSLLLDTHVAIWAINEPERIPLRIQALIENEPGHVCVSHISLWEIAIKHHLGRPSAPPRPASEMTKEFLESGFTLLPLDLGHILAFERIPMLHGNPYDRLLVAQAFSESLTLLTHDRRLAAYGDAVVAW